MKVDKAIEILSLAASGRAFTTGPDFYNSIKLGIEALKRVRERRGFAIPADLKLLPGEDQDIEEEVRQP